MTTTTKFENIVCTNCDKRNGKCLISKILDCGCKQLGIFCKTPNEAMQAIETAHQKQPEHHENIENNRNCEKCQQCPLAEMVKDPAWQGVRIYCKVYKTWNPPTHCEDIPFEPDPPKTNNSKLPTTADMQNVPF